MTAAEPLIDCFKKKPERAKWHCLPLVVFYVLYFCHTFLPSYQNYRALTFLNFNLVMALICLDLMLANMAAREFMAPNPYLLILTVPLIAYFGLGVCCNTEFWLSVGCVVLSVGLYVMRMTLLAIQFYDTTGKSFLFNQNAASKVKEQ